MKRMTVNNIHAFYAVKRNDGLYICVDAENGEAYYGLFAFAYFFGNYESAKRYTDCESKVVVLTVIEMPHAEENNET